jgi:nicotinate-nucleotide pyrophosphorylase
VDDAPAYVLLVIGWILLAATWLVWQRRLSGIAADTLTAVAGIAIATGGLLLCTTVTTASWVLAPALLVGGGILHRRVLFGGAGPFRT